MRAQVGQSTAEGIRQITLEFSSDDMLHDLSLSDESLESLSWQEKLILARARYIEECVETKMLADRETCERFYADYGESSANQAPLFYDLPACEIAHEYSNSYRSSSR